MVRALSCNGKQHDTQIGHLQVVRVSVLPSPIILMACVLGPLNLLLFLFSRQVANSAGFLLFDMNEYGVVQGCINSAVKQTVLLRLHN